MTRLLLLSNLAFLFALVSRPQLVFSNVTISIMPSIFEKGEKQQGGTIIAPPDCTFPETCSYVVNNWLSGSANSATYGIVFDTKVGSHNLYFYYLRMYLLKSTTAKVYMKSGSYHVTQDNLTKWTKVFDGTVSPDSNSRAIIDFSSSRFYAPAGSTVAFYISYGSGAAFVYSQTGTFSNADVSIQSGHLMTQQRGNTLPASYKYGSGYDFLDLISYGYAPSPTPVPSSTPSSSPSSTPSEAASTNPTQAVSTAPSVSLSNAPTAAFSATPSEELSSAPSISFSNTPSAVLSSSPSKELSSAPSASFSNEPSIALSSSPSEEVSSAPSISTPAPVTPTPAPITFDTCNDTTLRFKVQVNGRSVMRDCKWVGNKTTIQWCNIQGVSDACRDTCNACSTCKDTTLRFKLNWLGGSKMRDCTWIGETAATELCKIEGVAEVCPVTCGICP